MSLTAKLPCVGLFVIAALTSACGSQSNSGSPTSPTSPASKLGTVVSNVAYCTGAGVPQLMDIYYPTVAVLPKHPVVVYIHGGQLFKGNKGAAAGTPADMWRQSLAPKGYLFVSINYRLGPASVFPAMIEDSKCAIRYLRANAATYDLDPDRIGVTGTSSGGYLAALVALAPASAGLEGTGGFPGVSSAVQAAVVEYGADMDLRQPPYSQAEIDERTNAFPQPAPPSLIFSGTVINHVSAGDPPFLFFHGDRDSFTDPQDNIAISNALNAVGVSSSFQFVVNGGHGWDVAAFGPIMPSWSQLLQTEIAFFDSVLKK